ncbi:MAG: ribulose-phosphate 3-epimerase [Lachnospiraceae bacterium]|jgi:ribulose-phosphate 3-epimerase|uniref:ribulose-phosphate 3-epimerase n=1 Tax=Candidatus Merdisoma sp. JLR.KK006 TaxID=3112626 RepID=UPI002FEEF624|nr:ribulose-phosphate 3-epimerase [Lachnospiraceae bacterium]
MVEISISAFAADPFHLERDLKAIQQSGADGIHVDVMDGHFVPMFGFHQSLIRQMIDFDPICGDIHLMVKMTQPILERFLEISCRKLTLHVESAQPAELTAFLKRISRIGISSGLAISPGTEPERLRPFFPYLEEVLVMSCTPGTEGAVFEEQTYERIRIIRRLLEREKLEGKIAVDGGLNEERAVSCIRSGADRVVIGRAFFTSEDKKGVVERVRRASAGNL